MGKRYITNDTGGPIFVGGTLVQPGEGREVDEAFLPPSDALASAADGEGLLPPGSVNELTGDALDANLRELLKGTLKELVPQLADFSDETLERLAAIENEHEAPRKGLLEPLAELQLQRAQARAGGAPT